MPTLVFVHLNSQVPQYLLLNLHGMVKLFPEQKIVLIHNQADLNHASPGVTLYKFESSSDFLQIENQLSHPKDFRNNFWFTAIGRFEALRDYMQETDEQIIHVESDVILAKDFPFAKFQKLEIDIAFPLVASNRGVASTLFLGNIEAAEKLVNFAIVESGNQPDITDMEILAKIVHHPELKVLILPHAPAGRESFHKDIAGLNLELLAASLKYFGGLFDGNDIGVYLYGSNPRNQRGVSRIGQEIDGNFAAPSSWKFTFNARRNFIQINSVSSALPIFSIHATCKRKSLFWIYSRALVLRRIHKSQSSTIKVYPDVMTTMALQKIGKFLPCGNK